MDGLGSQHQALDGEPEVVMDAPPAIRFDERRMHVRAYNYWASLLGDRRFPAIEDLDPQAIEDFGPHSVLIDFTGGIEDPAIAFLGSALLRECELERTIGRISEVPPRTLLSRLTDHCLQIVANQAPIGFEAEFINQRGAEILYRGIMMPFSAQADSVDFVYGVINWKEVASPLLTDEIERAMSELSLQGGEASCRIPAASIWSDAPLAAGLPDEDEPTFLSNEDEADYLSDMLCQTLADAQGAAADALSSEGRTRHALYRAIGLAHDFALAARAEPDDYAALLAEAGVAPQPRSPMTALVRLIFGPRYDKTRLSEFAAVLDHALAQDVAPGALTEMLCTYAGGLKAYVRDARAARRDPARPGRAVAVRQALKAAPAVAMADIATDAEGLTVIVMRRTADGGLAPLGGLSGDDRRVSGILQAVAART